MADSKLVNIINAGNQFLEVFARLLLLKSLILDNQVKELTALDELHDQVEVLLCLDNLINLDNIGMVELLQYFDLPTYPLDIFLVLDP